MANEYPTAAEAQRACEEIAQRALVHISPQHFGIFEQHNQEIPSAGDVGVLEPSSNSILKSALAS
jgi:hypothetical protein